MSGDEPEDTAEATGSVNASEPELEAELQRVREEADLAARRRCQAIIESPHAKGRDGFAKHLAFATELPAEEAIAILRASPLVEPVTRKPNGKATADEFDAHAARAATRVAEA